MEPLTSTSILALPSEVLDIVTEKVRRNSPQSFHALEQTCKDLRNSGRRCAQILVIECSSAAEPNEMLQRLEELEDREIRDLVERALTIPASPSEILSREINLHPGLKRALVTGWLSMYMDLGFVQVLSRVSWVEFAAFSLRSMENNP
jgi:hypothetical protein